MVCKSLLDYLDSRKLSRRADLWAEGIAKMGRDAECARKYKAQMIAAGFVNVTETVYIVPNNQYVHPSQTS